MAKIEILKRQKRTVGSIVQIPLEKGYHTYAQTLEDLFAFYDCKTKEDIQDLQTIISSPILFITAVYDYAITKGYWLKVGTLPLEERLKTLPPQFRQDALQPHKFEIFYEDGTKKSATADECRGLERIAVWTPEGVQNRLNDYYAGRKNYSVESMQNPELSHDEILEKIGKSKQITAKAG